LIALSPALLAPLLSIVTFSGTPLDLIAHKKGFGCSKVKNREDRLIVLNQVANAVIEERRGKQDEYVFTYQDRRVGKMNNSHGGKRVYGQSTSQGA
jgi:hypothetical protein